MKSGSRPHAPRTGPGRSAGQTPPAVSPGIRAKPGFSAGTKSGTARSGDPKSSHVGSGKGAAGNQAMMRKPYG